MSVLDTALTRLLALQTTAPGQSFLQFSASAAAAGDLSGPQLNAGTIGAYVVVDVTAKDHDGSALLDQLVAIGLLNGAYFGPMVSGVLPVSAIGQLASIADVSFARESLAVSHLASQGSVVTQADAAEAADIARTTYNVDGTGLKVGVLSDSFNQSPSALSHTDDMAADIASADLPADTTILQDFAGADATDEGRAMAQLVHDIAPGASIAFATANFGQANFAANILALAAAGAKVIVDDVGYFAEPMFQDGVIAQAVNQVVAAGVIYFSAAGNDTHKGYEAPVTLGSSTDTISGRSEQFLDFAPGQSFLPVVLGASEDFVLQWDQPAESAGGPGATSDLDFFLTDSAGNVLGTGGVLKSTDDNIGHDPVEIIDVVGGAGQTAYLRVGLHAGAAPGEIKIVILGRDAHFDFALNGITNNTNDGTVYGHPAAAGAIAVGAASFADTPAFGTDPPVIEAFSSAGPTKILFDTAGNPLATPDIRQKPDITAPDGGNTTFFFSDTAVDADTLPNFRGTSAAAPDAAAAAVLMLAVNGALTAADVNHLLQDSSIDMDNPATAGFDTGYDFGTGSGLIQADKAVGFAKTLHITATAANPVMLGTHLADTFSGGSENDTFTGFGGSDTFVFAPGGHADTYRDFAAGSGGDVIDLTAYTDINTFQDVLSRASQPAADTIIDFGNGDTVTLTGVAENSLVAGNFLLAVPHVIGTPGDDSFTALPGGERIDAGSGVDSITFDFRLVDAHITFSGNQVIVDGPTGSHTVLTGFEIYNFTDGTVNDNDSDPLVDDLFYYSQNHDVWLAHADADAHYHTFGRFEGRDPDAFFSTSTYLSKNADVKAAGIDPLLHFDQFGWKEGRDPSILFDPQKYLAANPDVRAAGLDPLAHFLVAGEGELRQPIAPSVLLSANAFDYVYYLQHNPDVAAAHVDPLLQYETVGWKQGRNPNALFDDNGYLANYPDVAAAGINPLDHYNLFGWKEGRDPSVNFDTTDYLGHYPDVAAANINPLMHYLQFGQFEGRSTFADGIWG